MVISAIISGAWLYAGLVIISKRTTNSFTWLSFLIALSISFYFGVLNDAAFIQ